MTARICWALVALGLLAPAPALAIVVGHPGAPSPPFSLQGSAGLAYTARDLAPPAGDSGELLVPIEDRLRRFRVFGRVGVDVHERLSLWGLLQGATAQRNLTEFDGVMGVGGGGGVRAHALRQDDFGVNLTLGAGALFLSNNGTTPQYDDQGEVIPNQRVDDRLTELELQGELLFSRSFQVWNLYGGVLWNPIRVRQENPPSKRLLRDQPDPLLTDERRVGELWMLDPVGIVVGVDYFVTPLVYTSIEAQNLHTDAISLSVGMLISP